jgi:hypothetical protein
MLVRRIFAAPHLYPSDSTRQHPIRAGMRGLRHKPRHKIPQRRAGVGRRMRRSRRLPELSSSAGRGSMETPLHELAYSQH